MRRIATQGYRAAATFIDVAIPLRAIPAVFARLPGGRFTAGKATLKILVKWAYELTDDELAGLRQDLAVDAVRLLPEQVGVERPDVPEPVVLGAPGKVYDAPGRRVGLQYYAKLHADLRSGSGKGRDGRTGRGPWFRCSRTHP